MFRSAVVCLLLALVAPVWPQDPVKVSVYYETLCPDSYKFIVSQLYPVYLDLKDIMTPDPHSYGFISETPNGDGYDFDCQHGPAECEGNIMVTCAKKYITDMDKFMAFTNCIMINFVGAAAGAECALEAGVDFTDIDTCYNSVEGQQLLHEEGVMQDALDPAVNYVPWILIDDVAPRVKVAVFYESMCPDSRRFFVNQLYPVWVDLGGIMDLHLTSYGKMTEVSVGNDYKFKCQHGGQECEGNIMLTCSKKYISDQDLRIKFAYCVMQKYKGPASGKPCANENGVDFGPIEECMESSEGRQLQHQAGLPQATLSPTLNYVPWITINDVFSKKQLDKAQEDLRKVVCDAYQGIKPALCNLEKA